MRIAILASHPIQYQAPLYRELSSRSGIQVKVFFCWDFGVQARVDPGFGREVKWDVPLLNEYDHEFLVNTAPTPSVHRPGGIVNPDAIDRVSAWKPDAVVVHGYLHWTMRKAIHELPRLGIPVVMRGESHLLPRRPAIVRVAKQLWLRNLFRKISGFLAIGSLNVAYYRHYGVDPDRIHLAPYSIDGEFFSANAPRRIQAAQEWRRRLGIPDADRVVLYAAKFIPVKSCHDLLAAYAMTSRRSWLVLVGSGPLEAELKEQAARTCGPRVVFAGFVNQSLMPAAYELGDVFVLPSIAEPWGLAVNEAMSVGKPVIVSDQVGAAPDLVSSRNGWVFRAGDRAQLAAILEEATGTAAALAEKGKASKRRIAEWGIPETTDGYVTGIRAAIVRPAGV